MTKPTPKLASLTMAFGVFATLGASAVARDVEHPTVVELYQSQGCSSCPPAIANINALAGRKDLLALTFAVTYWDRLGWKDTFAQPAFTDRQWDYARANRFGNVSTPQTIINGRAFTNGGNLDQLVATIKSADRGAAGPSISQVAGKIMVGAAASGRPATIWLVQYDPRPIKVPIRAGENGGRTLVHLNVVRTLRSIATWRGQAISLDLPRAADPQLRSAVLVQEGNGGRIIAAKRI